MEPYYDCELGDWVTDSSVFASIVGQPRFAELREYTAMPEREWALLPELIAAVPDDLLYLVGCGLLDFFVSSHGAEFVDEIERAALSDARFSHAAREMSLHRGDLPPEVEARLVAAFGPGFALLPPYEPLRSDNDVQSRETA